jgi:hypothetical protein
VRAGEETAPATHRSPDLEIHLTETGQWLADSEIIQ